MLRSVCKFLSGLVLLTFAVGCTIQDAEMSKNQYLTIYTESVGDYDELIYKKFEKEEHIRVRVKQLKKKEILLRIRNERYNCEADLIILNDYEDLALATQKELFRPVESEILVKNIDPIYRSGQGKWFALSKSPLVIIYNRDRLAGDTIKNYYDLISPEWNGKIAFQDKDDPALNSFKRTIRLIMKDKAYPFLQGLSKQTVLPFAGDDITQIERIQRGDALLAVVKLSSLARQHKLAHKGKNKSLVVRPIFPNQRKKGCYITISGGGVYKYSANPKNAIKLLEFLSSGRAQYYYAAGRMHSPLIQGIKSDIVLESYGKFRGRFYRKVYKQLKSK